VRQRKQIITSLMMGGALAALSATTVSAAQQPAQSAKATPHKDSIAQANQQPLVPNPKITIDGVTPTPGVGLASPLMPRAVAPPVGDISVSNLDAAMPQLDLGSTAKVNMVLKNTPAREVLESLARTANLNLAYSDGGDAKGKAEATVSINLRNEPVQNAFNYVLQLSGLEANRIGNTIFVGTRLPDSIRETIVRTLRMNQVSATAAATFLAAQGADGPSVKAAGNGPLLLKGLSVSTDERLNAVTLVGSPRQVEMATSFLTRLDARRRQVALNVKIVDVNLSNADSMSNSLSFKAGDGFLSVDNGAAVYNYGGYNPATKNQTLSSPTTPPIVALNLPGGSQPFLDYSPNASQSGQTGNGQAFDSSGRLFGNIPRPGFGTTENPFQPGITSYTPGTPNTQVTSATGVVTGSPGTPPIYTYALPTNLQIPTKFLSTLQAQIISGNGKILTDPTLVVQEGQKSTVNLTQQVFGGFKSNTVAGAGATTSTREPIIKEAGLSLDIVVNRIDDNGFISVGVKPTVSSIGSTVNTGDGEISLLQSRTLDSGEIRLRDGQTLILSGIIQESDRTSVSKVPILGDIPILGALFRSTNKTNQRQEVVVLLTPQILDDNKTQVNYTPGVDARLMLGR
jgi:type IV pilus assembly protein PilQ